MNRFYKYLLIVTSVDILVIIILLSIVGNSLEAALLWLLLSGILMLIQLIVGISLTYNTKREELGKALLASIGLVLLIGLSICGIAANT